MQVIALALFWLLVGVLAGTIVLASFAMQIAPGLREAAKALRAGTIRSVVGALLLQMISAPLFLVLLLATWTIQYTARHFGASADGAIWVGLPVGLVALALPIVATISGAYVGFRAGWLRASGYDSQAALSGDVVAQLLRRIWPANLVRW